MEKQLCLALAYRVVTGVAASCNDGCGEQWQHVIATRPEGTHSVQTPCGPFWCCHCLFSSALQSRSSWSAERQLTQASTATSDMGEPSSPSPLDAFSRENVDVHAIEELEDGVLAAMNLRKRIPRLKGNDLGH